MKEFEMPEIRVELFAVEEILTGSSGGIGDNSSENDNQLPFG